MKKIIALGLILIFVLSLAGASFATSPTNHGTIKHNHGKYGTCTLHDHGKPITAPCFDDDGEPNGHSHTYEYQLYYELGRYYYKYTCTLCGYYFYLPM